MTVVAPPVVQLGQNTASTPSLTSSSISSASSADDFWSKIQQEAKDTLRSEPELAPLLQNTILAKHVSSFAQAVSCTIAHRLVGNNTSNCNVSLQNIESTLYKALQIPSIEQDVICDLWAAFDRDPACQSFMQVLLFYKGFAALVTHRAAHVKPNSMLALWLQSQSSERFGVDIHPAAKLGSGLLFDHGTGIVIGETASLGEGCTLLHGVTLGGTGKQQGDRHPKVGAHVLIGAGASILGNIKVGDNSKIGAGSIVLRAIPAGATAVGAPAKIVGRVERGENPAQDVDEALQHVKWVHVPHHKDPQKVPVRVDSTLTDSTELESSEDDDDSSFPENPICPFRELRELGQNAPPGTINICKLHKILGPHGLTTCETGQVLFAMDTRMVGYVTIKQFQAKCADCLVEFTSLTREVAEAIVTTYVSEHKKRDS